MFKRFKRKAIIYGLIFVFSTLTSFSWAVNIFVGQANEEYWADRNAKRLLDGGEATEDGIPAGTTYVNGNIRGGGNINGFNGSSNFIAPTSYSRVSSEFGYRTKPTEGASTNHKGIDLACPIGTPVSSALDGVVTFVGSSKSGGNTVYVQHANGMETRYLHLDSISVSVGQQVGQGSEIARSGNTGVGTGPHLHFEVRVDGTAVNPRNYFDF